MSGIEMVGLVLGAIPLLISGLEHYAEGIRTMKNMWDYALVVDHLVAEFTLDQAIFRHSCEELLMPVLSDSQTAELLQGASKWEDKELEEQLRNRLGIDYEAYTRAVRDLRGKIKLFIKKLGLDETTMLPCWIPNSKSAEQSTRDSFFRRTWRKVKIGFDESKLNYLQIQIRGTINQIDKLTKSSIAAAPRRVELEQCRHTGYWMRVRDGARNLFDDLSSNSYWPCDCPHPHRASLRLDVRKSGADGNDTDVRFRVLFSFDVSLEMNTSISLPWNWRTLDIHPSPNIRHQAIPATRTPPAGTKRVTFNDQKDLQCHRSSSLSYSTITASPSVSKIEDLCKVLAQLPQRTGCIGYLDSSICRHHLYTTASYMTRETAQEILCFHDVLRRRGQSGLGVKDKYQIALTVASAVLQLYTTPWLKEQWCLNDIHFLCGSEETPLITQAYVSNTFVSPMDAQHSSQRTQQSSAPARACIPNEVMFALGVALIEISFGVPILSLKETNDPELPPGMSEFYIASRLVKDEVIKAREHDKYAGVVLRCVRGQLSTLQTSFNLEEAAVQQSFHDDIILPLQQIHDTLYEHNKT